MKQQIVLIFFIVFILVISGYVFVSLKQKESKSLIFKENKYYKDYGESCFDRTTDDYIRTVCEELKNNTKKDSCYYKAGISTGYDRICHMILNKTLKQKCLKDVNVTISNNYTLKLRAENYDPCKRAI